MIAVSIGARIKCALVLIIFMLIPILPITGTIGLFIVIFRPIWFIYAPLSHRLILHKNSFTKGTGMGSLGPQ